MMIFSSAMRPEALNNNNGKPMPFSCDVCGSKGQGRRFSAKDGRKDWAVLPESWNETEDRRQHAKKPFLTVCSSADCQHRATDFTNAI